MKNKNLSVVGIGKLGLCFCLSLEKSGFNVIGVDINQDYVDSINKKEYKTSEPQVEEYLKNSKNFIATIDLKKAVDHSDILFVLVATPTTKDWEYGTSQIEDIVSKLELLPVSTKEKHFVICSTIMPGFCDSIKARLNKIGYLVSYNPEFIKQGSVIQNQHNPDFVLIGEANKEIGGRLEEIYGQVCHNKPYFARMKPLSAEITKIGLNSYLCMKIAFANMIGDLATIADKEVPEIDKILSAIGNDSRVGNKFFKYGYGYSGPCLYRDSKAFKKFSDNHHFDSKIPMAVDQSNDQHLDMLFQFYKKHNSIKDEAVFDYVTFKPESVLLDNSQTLKLAEKLSMYGYKVRIKERKEVIDQLKKLYKEGFFIYEQRD